MRFLQVYLICYFILLLGAGFAIWNAGIVQHIPGVWLAIGALVAVGVGVVLALVSGRPAIRN